MKFCGRMFSAILCVAILYPIAIFAATPSHQVIVNGNFEKGLSGWHCTGDVSLDTNTPIEGKASVRIGPGPGSISQRIPANAENHMMISATLHAEQPGEGTLTIVFFDKDGNELMRISKLNEKFNQGKLADFFKPQPLTASVEVVLSKGDTPGYVTADRVKLQVFEDNDPSLESTQDTAELMKPFWRGNTVSGEAVLMEAASGGPATGTLMFQPTRILSVTSYDGAIDYQDGRDYTVQGRTLIAPSGSHMTIVRNSDLLKDELAWNVIGGKQVLVTYEHSDAWPGPVQPYVGDFLPNTLRKFTAHEPLTIVAYGDSITFGIGSSHMRKIPPYQPPWVNLFAKQLKKDYADPQITLYNSSQSGAASDWAKEMAGPMVASLNPDLVIVAFGQNDFWNIDADTFARNILSVIETVRVTNPKAEFLLVSPLRFDPAYSSKKSYWDRVSEYDERLRALTGPSVQLVDMTAISEAVYAAKKPKDCLNDPLHPDDYFSRWYAQSMVAALVPDSNR